MMKSHVEQNSVGHTPKAQREVAQNLPQSQPDNCIRSGDAAAVILATGEGMAVPVDPVATSVIATSKCGTGDVVQRLRANAAEWAPTSDHTLRAHNLLEEVAYELSEWLKLTNPATLHANLLRGIPARLTRDQLLHLAGNAAQDGLMHPDARLIAAAPDMLEALEDLVALLPDPGLDSDDVQAEFVRKAIAAIASATGAAT